MEGLSTVGLGLLAALTLVSAVWVVTLRNLFRAALSLGLVLVGVAVFFLVLEAEFLAFVQILIYVGAILTLVVFAIMLTAKLETRHGQAVTQAGGHRQPVAAATASLGLFGLLVATTQVLQWPTEPPGEAIDLAWLGRALVEGLVLPFEVISLVFVAAIVGAIALAAGRKAPSA
jgi:NADH-quinone oxidoreductase subunit J